MSYFVLDRPRRQTSVAWCCRYQPAGISDKLFSITIICYVLVHIFLLLIFVNVLVMKTLIFFVKMGFIERPKTYVLGPSALKALLN